MTCIAFATYKEHLNNNKYFTALVMMEEELYLMESNIEFDEEEAAIANQRVL